MEELKANGGIMELIKALAKAKTEFKPARKSANNSLFNNSYATLSDIIEATREALSNNGLVLVQTCNIEDDESVMTTTLYHESGQHVESKVKITPPPPTISKSGNETTNELQRIGIARTYMQRYEMQAILGIAGEDDTDGNSQSQPQGKRDTKGKAGRVVGETYSGDGIIADNKPKTEPAKDEAASDAKNLTGKAKVLHDKRRAIHIIETYKGVEKDMSNMDLPELQAYQHELEAMPDIPKKTDKPTKTVDHQKIAEDVANATGFKVDDILEYFEAQSWDWKYIAQEHIKWIADDRAKEKFATDVSGYMASKNQPELPESEA